MYQHCINYILPTRNLDDPKWNICFRFAVQFWHRVGGTIIIATLQSLACSGSLQLIPLFSFPLRASGLSAVLFIERSSHNIHADIAQMQHRYVMGQPADQPFVFSKIWFPPPCQLLNHARIVDGFHVKCVMPSMEIAKPKFAIPPPVFDATCAIEAMGEGSHGMVPGTESDKCAASNSTGSRIARTLATSESSGSTMLHGLTS